MSLELYEVKECFSLDQLTENEKITSFTGYGENLFIGTSTGRLHQYVRENEKWSYRAGLEIPESKSIVHLVAASALGLVLALSDDTLFYVDVDGFLVTGASGAKTISAFALNSHPTNDDPFVLQIAIGSLQKDLLLCERRDEQRVDIRVKIPTDSVVQCVAYSKFSVCFATRQSYYVHNTEAKATHALFPYDVAVMRPIITNVGVEEFVLNGMQGLAVFVTGDGVSQRAPIFLASSNVRSIQYSAPFLYALADSSLNLFSLTDQQMKQSVSLNAAELMDNIDGWLVVVSNNNVFELVPTSIEKQVEDALNARDLSRAITYINEYASQFGADPRVRLKLVRSRQKAAFLALSVGELDNAIDQLVDSEIDPREVLSLAAELCPADFKPDEELHRLLDGNQMNISLDFAERYLRRIRPFAWSKPHTKTIECALFRIYVLSDRFEQLSELDASHWNNDESRAWLLSRGRVNLAAEFSFEAGHEAEAMELWRALASGEKQDPTFALDSCFERLSRLPSKSDLLTALGWLVPINPALAFQCARDNGSVTLSTEEAYDAFAPHPDLLIQLLEERMRISANQRDLHAKLANAYVEVLRSSPLRSELRQKFRTFLFDSSLYDSTSLRQVLQQESSLRVEALLLKAKSEEPENCLREILENDDELSLSAAELLCARLNATHPRLLRILLDSYLRIASKDETMRDRLPKLLDQLESDTSPTEVLRQIPQDVPVAEVANFLQRTFAHASVQTELLRIRQILAAKALETGAQRLSLRSTVSFRIDDDTKCGLCGQLLGRENFVRYPDTDLLAHQRCHSAR